MKEIIAWEVADWFDGARYVICMPWFLEGQLTYVHSLKWNGEEIACTSESDLPRNLMRDLEAIYEEICKTKINPSIDDYASCFADRLSALGYSI